MIKQNASRIRQIYDVVQSVSIAAAAICLMTACVSIYQQGDHPFSREVVAESFSGIAVPVYLCLATVLGGFLLDLFLPRDAAKLSAGKEQVLVLKRLHAKTDLSKCDESLQEAVLAQQMRRATHKKLRTAVLTFASLLFLSYALNSHNFHQSEINGSMIRAMMVLLPCLGLSFGYASFVAYDDIASVEKEISLLKQAGSEAAKPAVKESAAIQPDKKMCTVRTVVLAIGIVFLVYGFFAGGTIDVLTKAVNICTECVGLG